MSETVRLICGKCGKAANKKLLGGESSITAPCNYCDGRAVWTRETIGQTIDRLSVELFDARAEITRLSAIVAGYQESAARVTSGQCAKDERHCSCVPELRKEIERLKEANDHNMNRGAAFEREAQAYKDALKKITELDDCPANADDCPAWSMAELARAALEGGPK